MLTQCDFCPVSTRLIADIKANQGGADLATYMEQSFDVWGLESEPLEDEVLLVKPTQTMIRNESISLETMDHYHYPELPEDGLRVTYNREVALSREDVIFSRGKIRSSSRPLIWSPPISSATVR